MTYIADTIAINANLDLGHSKAEPTESVGVFRYQFQQTFAAPPAVFLTATTANRKLNTALATQIATVVATTTEYVDIYYSELSTTRFLNILVISADSTCIGDAPLELGKIRKSEGYIRIDKAFGRSDFVLTTPYWHQASTAQPVSSQDFVSTRLDSYDEPDKYFSDHEHFIQSGNRWDGTNGNNELGQAETVGYFVNFLQSVVSCGAHVQSGHHLKGAGPITRVFFPEPWPEPPVVLVSPWYASGQSPLKGPETVTAVTNEYFDVQSPFHSSENLTNPDNMQGAYLLNWMAVRAQNAQFDSYGLYPELPEKHIDDGLDRFFDDFSEHRNVLHEHRDSIKKALLHGDLSQTHQIVGEHHHNDRLRSGGGEPSEKELAIAKVVFDCVAMVASTVGLMIAANADLVRNIATELKAIGEAAKEVQAMTEKMAEVIETAKNMAENAQEFASNAFFVVGGLWTLGLLKTIVSAIASTMPFYQWVIMGAKLYAQIGLILASWELSAGMAAPFTVLVYVARMAVFVTNSVTFYFDLSALADIIRKEGRSPAPS